MFVWHQRHSDLDALRTLAWDAGLVVILTTDASGEIGWGVAAGSVWRQGTWNEDERDRSINWKELKTYEYALLHRSELLRDKLVFVKLDNTCAVHYINAGSGRLPPLSDLAKSIRLREARLGIESVAVHLPGEKNATADGLPRLTINAKIRDRHPDRCLRRRLFAHIALQFPGLSLDGFAADDGHNAQLQRYRCPSDSFFGSELDDEQAWLFPADELVGPLLRFLQVRRRARKTTRVVLLVPEGPSAPWFFMLAMYKRVSRFVIGSDLFRESTPDGRWSKMHPVRDPWVVVSSFAPAE